MCPQPPPFAFRGPQSHGSLERHGPLEESFDAAKGWVTELKGGLAGVGEGWGRSEVEDAKAKEEGF